MLASLESPKYKKWWIVIAMSLSLGMTFIDQTGVAIALPRIQSIFDLSSVALQWIVNSYILTFAVFLSLGGYLGDLYQHHRVFSIGLIIFMIASLACSVAFDIQSLLVSRALQGLGAALVLPNTSVIIINTFDINERGKAMGIYMASSLLFLPLALLIGGMFTQYISWRLIFAINLPLCILCLYLVYRLIPTEPKTTPRKIDWLGLLLLIVSTSSLVIALMEADHLGWHNPIIHLLLAVALIGFISFYWIERKQPNPIIDFKLFNNKIFLCAAILVFCLSFAPGLFVYDALFFQQILSYPPGIAGLLFLPSVFCVMFAAPIAGKLLDKYGFKLPVTIGLILIIIGLSFNGYLVLLQNYWYLLPGMMLINIGTPFVLSSINTAALSSVGQEKRGTSSGILNAIRQIANSIFVGVLTAIVIGLNHHFLEIFANKHPDINMNVSQLEDLLHHPTRVTALQNSQYEMVYHTTKSIYTSAYSIGIYTIAIVMCFALICTLLLFRSIKDHD